MQHAHYAAAGAALHRRAAPLPALAPARLRPRAPPRRRALPVRARDGRARHAARRRHAVRRLRLAAAGGARRARSSDVLDRGGDVSARRRDVDPFDVRRASNATGLLRDFNDAGRARRPPTSTSPRARPRSAARTDERSRSPRRSPSAGRGSATSSSTSRRSRETATVDADEAADLSALPWPRVAAWLDRLAASPLVAVGEDDRREPAAAPGRHRALPRPLLARGAPGRRRPAGARRGAPGRGRRARSRRASPGCSRRADDRQRLAAAAAVRRRFAVVAGGPGTGKTTTVARIVALLAEQAAAAGAPRRSSRSPRRRARPPHDWRRRCTRRRRGSTSATPSARSCSRCSASTSIACSAGAPDSHSRFRHHRGNRLPHDVVIVDETSMVSLSLMARLVEAVRAEARLVLVGDPGQLTSIEAGAVLGDIVGPRGGRAGHRRARPRVHRFGGGIADAGRRHPPRRRRRDYRRARRRADEMHVAPGRPATRPAPALAPVRDGAVAAARAVIDAARDGDAPRRARRPRRLPRPVRPPPRAYGVPTWTARIERWLATEVDGFGAEGRVVRRAPAARDRERLRPAPLQRRHRRRRRHRAGRVSAAFERRGEVIEFSPSRLAAVDTRLRDDRPQEPGLAVRHGRRPAARPDVARSSRASCSTRR